MSGGRPGLQRAGSSVALINKTIVFVTGGNTGIGYEIVKALATTRPDYQILLGCRDVKKGEEAASKLGALGNINPIQIDITDDASIDHAYKAIEQHFGRIDILINNAGTAGTDLQRAGLNPSPREVWQHIYNVNVISTGVFTERFIPLLQHSKLPKIIFISSLLGSIGAVLKNGSPMAPDLPHYSSSKTAVNMLAVHYATQYPNIKVNTCCPGYRATGLNDMEFTEEMDPAKGAINALRLATEDNTSTATYTNAEGTLPW